MNCRTVLCVQAVHICNALTVSRTQVRNQKTKENLLLRKENVRGHLRINEREEEKEIIYRNGKRVR